MHGRLNARVIAVPVAIRSRPFGLSAPVGAIGVDPTAEMLMRFILFCEASSAIEWNLTGT